MLKFIWNSWWRNKERFLLVLIGALIVSIGLSYLVGITQASTGTIVDELQKRWKSSYHIVVRHPDSRSVTEDKNLLEPNYLSGLSGGISLEQYEQIKSMSDVDVAAPIAMMGYIQNDVTLDMVDYAEAGIYRLTIHEATNTGVQTEEEEAHFYFTEGWVPPGTDQSYGVSRFVTGNLSYGTNILLAGVDPKAEAELVGLEEAIIEKEYFAPDDVPTTSNEYDLIETKIPVIVSNKEFVDGEITYTIEKLDIPAFQEDPSTTMEMVKEEGGEQYLDGINGEMVDQFQYTTEEAHQEIIDQISNGSSKVQDFLWMTFKPSSVSYREVTSPYPDRWPYTYEVEPYITPEDSLLATEHSYRPISMFSESSDGWPRLRLDFKGIFDPSKLDISKDPLTELPMETYFPSKAEWVLDKNNQPVNPPAQMKPLNNPYGFLTKPPLLLTTLEAAQEVLGDKPISAIRVKVKGVEDLNEESEAILQEVANKIEKQTGLITDITLGSSPQMALTHIPGVGEKESLGWVQQPWIKIGSSVSIFKESKVGMSGVIASVILVAIVYVFSSNLIMMFARKKEFAVLLALGWKPNQLSKLLFIEAAIIGAFVSFISWFILGFIYLTNDIDTSILRLILIGIFGFAIYLLGTLIPGYLVRKISPYETMKTGEITKQKRFIRTKTVIAMSFNNLVGKWKRSILSVIAIALPTSLLIFFLFITFRLRGIMYTTWLGEYVAMEVGSMHYIAMGVAVAIAILTTAEIIWQNVSERQPELAVLKALGWRNKTVRNLVLLEGALSGLLGGIIGVSLSFLMIWGMYGTMTLDQILFFAATIFIPIVMGMIGALLPAQKAVKLKPYQGMQGVMASNPKQEKKFKMALGSIIALLFAGCIVLVTLAVPEVKNTVNEAVQSGATIEGTQGDVQDQVGIPSDDKEEGTTPVSTKPAGRDVITEDVTKKFELGQYVWEDDGSRNLYFGEPIETPDSVKLENVGVDMKVLTIPITYENLYMNENAVNPLAFDLISPDGEASNPYHFEIMEEDGYQSGLVKGNGMVKFAVTYVYPKDEPGWHISFKDWDWGDTFDRIYNIELP